MTVKVNHIEIPVLDLEKAKRFFDSVFGWNMNITSMGPTYGLVNIQDGASLGFTQKEKIVDLEFK